jgi:endonuclease G
LATGAILTDRLIGVVGYPARDGRNDSNAMSKVFGDIYNVKRFSPGKITDASTKDWFFDHDCSTLGGNSGSAVIELETGHAVGLHFSGGYRHSNYAVRADALEKLLTKLGRRTKTRRAPARLLPAGIQEKQQPISAYAQKEGYDHSFLGSTFKLPLPKVKDHDAVLVLDSGETELRYTHFSVVMHVARRLPILTAVNVHGGERRFVSRKGTTWYFDPRLPREAQVGSEFYGPTDFDRGHMVRREDPIWGERDKIARLANEDTFHYTNACPQHPDLNQKSWLELENFILDTTDVRDLLVSVFTGPVLSKEDPEIAGVQVPVQFWKVVAVIDDNTDALAVTGYMQSQEALVSTMEYRFGAMKTYQVPLRRIERLTGLDFGRKMRAADALEGRETNESLGAGEGSIEIRTPADIRLP